MKQEINLETHHRYTPFLSTWVVAKTSMFGDRDNAVIGTSTSIKPICLANITSQILRLPSILDERSHFPSSLKHKSVIRSLWPPKLRTSRQATTSNNLIVRSFATVARRPKKTLKLFNHFMTQECELYSRNFFSSLHTLYF